MRKSFKKVALILAAIVVSASGTVFAKPAMYGKLTAGYDARWGTFGVKGYGDDTGDLVTFRNFMVTPTFGMIFAPESDNGFMRGFGMELGLGLGIGRGNLALGWFYDDASASDFALVPRFDLVYHLLTKGRHFGEQKFVMHFMLGFEIPVFFPLEHKNYWKPAAFFDVNLLGVGFDIKLGKKLDLVADMYLSLLFAFDFNVGIVYRF